MSPDPLAEEFYSYSPYNAMMNDPINYIDPDGMLAWKPNGDGTWTAEAGDGADRLAQQAGISVERAREILANTPKDNPQGNMGTYVDSEDGVLKSAVDEGDVVYVAETDPEVGMGSDDVSGSSPFSMMSAKPSFNNDSMLDMNGDGNLDGFVDGDMGVEVPMNTSEPLKKNNKTTIVEIGAQKGIEKLANEGLKLIFGKGAGSMMSSQPLNSGEGELLRRNRLNQMGIDPNSSNRQIDSVIIENFRKNYLKNKKN